MFHVVHSRFIIQLLTLLRKLDDAIQHPPEKDATGPVDVPLYLQTTLPALEHLPPSQPLMNPPTGAARLARVCFGDQKDLLSELLSLRQRPLPKPRMRPRHHRADRLAVDLTTAPSGHLAAVETRDDDSVKGADEP